ncbi:hypothetical protein OIO90_002151 [Microbotryomycetes sp. JL221]|nr:hypothetical protein OIO90_002151 [Microbotryomycetes sp. JL221]
MTQDTVLIIGAGCFGAATALELLQTTFKHAPHNVTILDRGQEPPATDSASSDHNKIVRQDYTDELRFIYLSSERAFYALLANQAIKQWRTSPLYKSNFFESGVMVASNSNDLDGQSYVKGSLAVNLRQQMKQSNKQAFLLDTPQKVKQLYKGLKTGSFNGLTAYYNESGGWADSRQAVVDVLKECKKLGATFVTGEATNLIKSTNNDDIKGVQLRDGRQLKSDLIVLASGAWTSLLVPECGRDLLPTGQVVATIQMTQQEADKYRNVPVTLLLDTGFYCFPPTQDNVFKFAIHGPGYLNPAPILNLPSIPRTALTKGYENQTIPNDAILKLKQGLSRVFPDLVEREWMYSRLCWYTDRASGDWLIDYHPKYKSLLLATGGSGHAFKFLPILGRLVCARLNNTQTYEQGLYWSFHGCQHRLDKSRGQQVLKRGILELDPQLQRVENEKKSKAKL